MTDSETAALKRAAAFKALDFVKDGMKLGLGTGTTAEAFLDVLAPRVKDGLRIVSVATSIRTADKARALGIAVSDLDSQAPLDLTIDGADEADRALNLIKGGGGAHLREKIVATSSRKMVVIADETKLVEKLGRFPLPVEVTQFSHVTTAARVAIAAHELGYKSVPMTLRMRNAKPFVTDGGNYIYDCTFGAINDAAALGDSIRKIPGVVEHGLFVGIASVLIIARATGTEVIERK
jgi:ribose 5-phosphate isomerase A